MYAVDLLKDNIGYAVIECGDGSTFAFRTTLSKKLLDIYGLGENFYNLDNNHIVQPSVIKHISYVSDSKPELNELDEFIGGGLT